MKKLFFLWLIPMGMTLSSCGAYMQGMAQAFASYGAGAVYPTTSTQQGNFYYPVPQYNLTKPKFTFSAGMTETSTAVTSGGAASSSTSSSGTSSSGGESIPKYTKTCGVCRGTGTCNICAGDGWVSTLGMGKDHFCTACTNHNGKCSSCGGRGTWKE